MERVKRRVVDAWPPMCRRCVVDRPIPVKGEGTATEDPQNGEFLLQKDDTNDAAQLWECKA